MLTPEAEHSFMVKGLTLKAKSWGNPDSFPVVALHGWLDNCNSFKLLSEKLNNIYLVAIDFAGNGESDYRSLDSGYNSWQDVADVFEVADALGFDKFCLLGHSRGAFVAHLCTGTFPERVSGLVLLDGFAPPEFADVSQTPQQLAKAIKTTKRFSTHKRRVHSSIDRAVKERSTRGNPLSEPAARVLAERGMKAVDGGVIWSSDPRLQAASDYKFSKGQCQAFVDRVTCKALLILAKTEFSDFLDTTYLEMAGDNPLYSRMSIDGSHHLHMEQVTIDDVATSLNSFFATLK